MSENAPLPVMIVAGLIIVAAMATFGVVRVGRGDRLRRGRDLVL